ncbi:MAG: OmpA family protein [Polyangiaceae bacterium]
MKRVLASLVALTTFGLTAEAAAQSEGFALNRFDPSERGSDWFSAESLDLRGHMRPALGAVFDYGYKPLVYYDRATDEEQLALVKHQLFAHLGGSLVLWERLRLGLNVPVVLVNDGGTLVVGGTRVSPDEGAGIGDVRVGADVRILGEYRKAFSLAAGLQLHLPTGKQEAFTGDGKVRVVPRLLAAGDIGPLAYAARASFNYRAQQDDFDGEAFGSEVGFGAALGVRLVDDKLLLGPELYGSTVVSDGGNGAFDRKTTPVEVVLGGHYNVADDWRVGLGAGPGLSRGYGSPQVRVLASIEWFPKVEEAKPEGPKDTDGDGIYDQDDACVTVPGVATEDPKTNGCPPPSDRDGDGILDEVDACPDVKGVATEDPKTNGCPPPNDRDGDGILDEVDACPDEKGVATEDPKTNGCPPPKDTDADGIVDPEDACPDLAGPPNEDPKKHGCPKAKVVGSKIEILERVEFDTNKATIRKESDPVLNAVLDILKRYPGIKKVSVEGHTDNRGGAGYNMNLSRRRAASVVKWLVDNGIDKGRLTSQGFGQTKPIDTNDTQEGRQNNRRVEFNITEGEARTETEVQNP